MLDQPPAESVAETESTPQSLDVLGKAILAHIKAGDKAKLKSEEHTTAAITTRKASDDHYLAAGLQLIEVKKRPEINFEAFLKEHCCGIKHSRAYELIKIASGKTTLEETRAKTNERKTRHRAAKAAKPDTANTVRSAGTGTDASPAAAPRHGHFTLSQKHMLENFQRAVDTWCLDMNHKTLARARAYFEEATANRDDAK